MARTVTLTSLLAQVRQRADIESATARHPDSQLTEYINQSWAELHDELAQSVQDYLVTSSTISVVNGTDTYSLPATFYKLRAIFVTVGSSYIELHPFHIQEIGKYQYAGGWYTDAPMAYHLTGSNILFKPTPNGAYTVTLYFTPAPARVSVVSETFDGIAGWEEFVVWDSAAKVMARDERDPSYAQGKAREQLQRITRMAATRNSAEPSKILKRNGVKNTLRGVR